MPDPEATSLDGLLRHSAWLTCLARRLVVPTMADDLVQDTWLAALRNPPRELRSPRAWLSRVARRLARLREPSRGVDRACVSREDCPPTDEVVARIEQERLLARLVVELEEPHRSVILRRFYRGLSAERIARLEGVPAATVRTRSRRALALLRERLEREHGADRRGWPLASLFFAGESGALTSVGKGALLMGTKTTVALGVASGVLCTLAVTEGVLPVLEHETLRMPERTASAADEQVAAATPDASLPHASVEGTTLGASSARDPSGARRPLGSSAERALSPEDLRRLLLSSDRIEQVRAIRLLAADGSADAKRLLLDVFASTSDRVLLALLEEALLDPSLDVAPSVLEALLASDDPQQLERWSGLLARLASARPELQEQVIAHFLDALEDPDGSPARAGAAVGALASLGGAAADELGDYLAARESGLEGVGSAAWLLAELPAEYGEEVREKLAASLQGSIDVLGEEGLGPQERDAMLQKTGSLAWSASLRPEPEHDRLGEVLLESLLATHDPAQAGTLAWGLGSLEGLTDGSRIETTRALLEALNDQTDDPLCQQYLRVLRQLAVDQPSGSSLGEIVRLIQDARALRGEDDVLAPRLEALLAELRAVEERGR